MYMCSDHFSAVRTLPKMYSRDAVRAEARTCMACALAEGDCQFPTYVGKVATWLRSVWKEQASTPTSDTLTILELADAEAAHHATLIANGITEESILKSYEAVRAAFTCDPTTATRKA